MVHTKPWNLIYFLFTKTQILTRSYKNVVESSTSGTPYTLTVQEKLTTVPSKHLMTPSKTYCDHLLQPWSTLWEGTEQIGPAFNTFLPHHNSVGRGNHSFLLSTAGPKMPMHRLMNLARFKTARADQGENGGRGCKIAKNSSIKLSSNCIYTGWCHLKILSGPPTVWAHGSHAAHGLIE